MVNKNDENKDKSSPPVPVTPPTPPVTTTDVPNKSVDTKEPTEKERRQADNKTHGTSDLTDAEQLDAARTELADREGKGSRELNKKATAVDALPIEGRRLLAGTVLTFADKKIVLAESVVVNYEGEESEAAFVGMCHLTENLDVNRPTLKFRYDGLGTRLPLAEQVDDQRDLPAFIKTLEVDEAAGFGIDEATLNGYKAA